MNSVKGIFLKNESMANHTSWRCGGNAAFFFEPRSIQDLAVFLASFEEKRETVSYTHLTLPTSG